MIKKVIFTMSLIFTLDLCLAKVIKASDGSLLLPRNSAGKVISIRLPSKNKKMSLDLKFSTAKRRLIAKIKNADIPKLLKSESLRDLEKTSFYISNEMILYQDMLNSSAWKEYSKEEEKTTDQQGKTTTKVKIKYVKADVSKTGRLQMDAVDYFWDNKKATYLAAFSVGHPSKSSTFFEVALKTLNDEQLEMLILHEQGHRLTFLSQVYSSERDIKIWEGVYLNYLNGDMDKIAFNNYTENLGLRWDIKSIQKEIVQTPNVNKYGEEVKVFKIQLSSEDVLYWGRPGNVSKYYFLQMKDNVFNQHPNVKKYIAAGGILRISAGFNADETILNIKQQLENNDLVTFNLAVWYKTLVRQDDNGIYFNRTKVNSINLLPENFSKIKADFSKIMDKHFKRSFLSLEKLPLNMFTHSDMITKIVATIDLGMNIIKKNAPRRYATYNAHYAQVFLYPYYTEDESEFNFKNIQFISELEYKLGFLNIFSREVKHKILSKMLYDLHLNEDFDDDDLDIAEMNAELKLSKTDCAEDISPLKEYSQFDPYSNMHHGYWENIYVGCQFNYIKRNISGGGELITTRFKSVPILNTIGKVLEYTIIGGFISVVAVYPLTAITKDIGKHVFEYPKCRRHIEYLESRKCSTVPNR